MKIVPALLIASLLFVVIACSKDKFETKPLIEIRSYNSKVIPQHGTLTIRVDYFDKEGDLGGGEFFAARERLNIFPLGPNSDRPDTLRYTLPDFPARDKGEISIQLNYDDFLKESFIENDTIQFRLAVTDIKGNKSDTITTEKIVILLP